MNCATRVLVTGAAAVAALAATAPATAAPSGRDVTKVEVTNNKRTVVVRLSVPDLDRAALDRVAVELKPRRQRETFTVGRFRFDGRWGGVVLVQENAGAVVRCKGDRVRIRPHYITVRVPKRCLGGGGRAVRVREAQIGYR
ncbi:hypothetical protein [Mumia sp. Pv 4-285]|uniref:hypothetical protein n=1 Tax=Mumia qirimensis TaxID=3234852 RepID=UPI00351D7BF8